MMDNCSSCNEINGSPTHTTSPVNILVTLNSNYLYPLKVMLKSLFFNNPGNIFAIYLIHTDIKEAELADIQQFIADNGQTLNVIKIADDYFDKAPTVFYYTKEMYYRLLAFKLLPEELDRILYLDPDILVLNPVNGLYDLDMQDNFFAAAYHDIPAVKKVNKLRLNLYDIDEYYNSGVLLMNLALQRQNIDEHMIFEFVEKNHAKLIMPDQDVLNALFAKKIYPLDEKLYNYDARYFRYYKISSNGFCNMNYVIRNTIFLHFCGKRKPWKQDYSGKFEALYKHYEKWALG